MKFQVKAEDTIGALKDYVIEAMRTQRSLYWTKGVFLVLKGPFREVNFKNTVGNGNISVSIYGET